MLRKKYLIYSILILVLQPHTKAIGTPRYCDIKFNVKTSQDNLQKRMNIKTINSVNQTNNKVECFKIGVEHDQNKRPIYKNPIYACCKKI